MARIFMMLLLLGLNTAFMHTHDESSANSPSPEGDTRMGADAATTGTDITDKELQAQEDKSPSSENDHKDLTRKDPTEEDHTNIDAK